MTDALNNASILSDDDFIRLFTTSQRPLFLHILPLVGNATDADEVLQETNVILWSKRADFQKGTNFLAWGRAIARLEVFRFRRRHHSKVHFLSDDMINLIADRTEDTSLELDRRQAALTACLKQLKDNDRRLIQMRYAPGATGDDVAKQLGRPPNSVYQSIGRIRRILMECIQHRLADGGMS